MKKIYHILSLFVLITTIPVQAQVGGNRPGPERIKALKTAHITNALNLNSSEAQSFWPVYNEYAQRMEAIRRSQRLEISSIRKKGAAISDADANALLDKLTALKQNELDERKALIKNLKGVISPQKILRLQQAEEEFKRRLLEEIQRRRKN